MYELIRFIREAVRRARQNNSETRRGISRLLNTLEIKAVWEKAQGRVTKHSIRFFQEGIELVRVRTGATHSGVLETLRQPQGS
jgi:hypothetical protein